MLREIISTSKGHLSHVGKMTVQRLLPNSEKQAVGPFVFLDNIPLTKHEPTNASKPDGSFAHPHRGIATFSYLLLGEMEHFDSYGNNGIIGNGGIQWMKAGNGIIHDEGPSANFQRTGGLGQGMQFWINLPAVTKLEQPEYIAIQGDEVPEVNLDNEVGVLRILIGEYQNKFSKIKQYSKTFLYHIKLQPHKTFSFESNASFEYACFMPDGSAKINNYSVGKEELLIFGKFGDDIVFENRSDQVLDIILFGGEPYLEPIVAIGPYVMNTYNEIMQADSDYRNGKYGEINYDLK